MMLLALIQSAYAQGITNPVLPTIGHGEGGPIFGNIISAIIGMFLIVGFIFAILHFMFGAMRWVTASGDKTALQSAQERMTQAVVGLLIMAAIWGIMIVVGQFTDLIKTNDRNSPFIFQLPKLNQ